jgi:hypothetical protein
VFDEVSAKGIAMSPTAEATKPSTTQREDGTQAPERTAIRHFASRLRSGSDRNAQAHHGDAIPEKETVADGSQGVQLAFMQALARYWATDYNWRRCEAQLNAHPQFITEIDGLDIHFLHVRRDMKMPCRSSSPTAGLARPSSS